ncbi:tautomerase family protein [Paenibacillus sp. CMAA1364]
MAQVKIYGLRNFLKPFQKNISDIVHSCLVETLKLPNEKRFQRFIMFDREEFIYPKDRTEKYTIIEISIFEGRSVEVKKNLINALFENFSGLGVSKNDLEITIIETPKCNWGIRGLPGDELELNYKVDI